MLWMNAYDGARGPNRRCDGSFNARASQGYATQMRVLLRKHIRLVVTDPVLYLARMITFPIANLFFLVVYIETRDRVQIQALRRCYLVMWLQASGPQSIDAHYGMMLSSL